MLKTVLAATDEELAAVLALQQENLQQHLSADDVARDGFVTVVHTPAVLAAMNAAMPAVVVKDGEAVVGYALSMPQSFRREVPVLEPMFARLQALAFRGAPLSSLRWYVLGQVCVKKSHRGRGVFDALYAGHRDAYADRFDLVVTEVSLRNARSLRAHARVGFETLVTFEDATDAWAIVGWDLGRTSPAQR